MYDFYTDVEVATPEIECPECSSSEVSFYIDKAPAFKFPVGDLSFYKSRQRVVEGLYHDANIKHKKKVSSVKNEMKHQNLKDKKKI